MKRSPYNLGSHVQFRYTDTSGVVISGLGKVVQIRPANEPGEYSHKVKAIGGIYHFCLMRELKPFELNQNG